MGKKASKQTKSKIVSAAWKLFYEQGYDETTVEDILQDVDDNAPLFND